MITSLRHLVAATLGAFLLVAGAPGQTAPGQAPSDAGLDPHPLVVESLGLRFHPPADAVSQVKRVGRRVTVTLVDGTASPEWSMNIQTVTSALADPTPASEIEQLLETWRAAGRTFDVLANRPSDHGGRQGQVCWVEQEAPGGENVVIGWLVLPAGGRELLVFTFQTLRPYLPKLSSVLTESFRTIQLRDISSVDADRMGRLEAGLEFLAGLSEERLRVLIGETTLLRFHNPTAGPNGESVELGYVEVVFEEAPRGALNPERLVKDYDPGEQETGLFVRVTGRLAAEPSSGVYYDSRRLYWMAWDQSEESWSILGTHRVGSKSQSEAETGLRTEPSTGDPAGTLRVISSKKDGTTRTPKEWRVPEGYMSQTIHWGIGMLLPREPGSVLDLSTFCYDTGTSELSLRRDRWEPKQDGSGRWVLSSRPTPDAEDVLTEYDARGRLISRVWPDGSRSDPIDAAALQRLWHRKGLRTRPEDR